jgi:hypothetical protein
MHLKKMVEDLVLFSFKYISECPFILFASSLQEPSRTRFQNIPDEELRYYRTGEF